MIRTETWDGVDTRQELLIVTVHKHRLMHGWYIRIRRPGTYTWYGCSSKSQSAVGTAILTN